MKALAVTIGILLLGFAGQVYADGILFVGADVEELNPPASLPDNLGRFTTSGATITGGGVIATDFFLNGMTVVGNTLVTGTPNSKTITTADFNGNQLETFVGDLPNRICCNEDYAYDGTSVWQANWVTGGITELDPNNLGGTLLSHHQIADVVGMTFAEGQIWISIHTQKQVGTWNPATNAFTPVFTVTTPGFLGGLAYDRDSQVLWIGQGGGGLVSPWTLDGVQINAGFHPFGTIADNVDGLAFFPDAGTLNLDIKPGSDPNSINCNNHNGVIPVAILTTEDFDATTVDHTTVRFEGASETHVNRRSGEARRHEEDVDGDGDTDLVFHFRLGDTALGCSSTEGTLTGETFAGEAIDLTDSVRMVGGTTVITVGQPIP